MKLADDQEAFQFIKTLKQKQKELELKFGKEMISKQLLEFIEEELPFIAKGGTRSVFALGEKFVLKVALDYSQNIQNQSEYTSFKNCGAQHKEKYLAECITADTANWYWLVMERVNTNLFDVAKIVSELLEIKTTTVGNNASYAIRQFASIIADSDWEYFLERAKDKTWAKEFIGVLEHCSIPTTDIVWSNVGARESTGDLVLIDYADRYLSEQNSLGAGNVVGYILPLGMDTKPGHKKMWSKEKGKKAKLGSAELDKDIHVIHGMWKEFVEEMVGAMHDPDFKGEAMPGLWKGLEDPDNSVKTDSPELHKEQANKSLMNQMGYKLAGKSDARIGAQQGVYLQKDDSRKKKSKKDVKASMKNLDKTKKDSLHDPAGVGISLSKKAKG